MAERGRKIAVIGGGVSGIVAAHLLQRAHEVTLFEKNDYLGGHTHTIEIPAGPDEGLPVDTGFIVLNDSTYPKFQKFLFRLGVDTRLSEMSFGFHCRRTGLVYAGTDLNGLFARRRHILSPSFFRFLAEIARFCKKARDDLAAGAVASVTLGRYLEEGRFRPNMIENYLLPMAAAIWSTPVKEVLDYPAQAFLDFFHNHGLLSLRNRPPWRTLVGGSHSYVRAFTDRFEGRIFLNSPVEAVLRASDRPELILRGQERRSFDQVVIATHADQALRLLESPSPIESRLLSPWAYRRNQAVLHTDSGVMPEQKRAWAAWNFVREKEGEDEEAVFVTYYMNRLQGLRSARRYFVTLNRPGPFPPESIIAEMDYHHPLYTFASLATQTELPLLNGRQKTFFCGSYFGRGFHEDAVKAGLAVANCFGIEL